MKTKQLLTAMALPLFFAACAQEEIVTENNASDLSSRKVVGQVTINLNEESMSRMAFVGGDTPYKWEAGDQFGACLMDEVTGDAFAPDYITPDYVNEGFWSRFTLVDYIHTNYPFTRQKEGYWTSEAVMSEGNYFFYYPFNNNLGGRRSPIKLDIPTKQVLADGAKATSALDNQLFVGYSSVQAKVGKEKETVDVTMEPLLAFPGFRLKNTGTSTVKVRKIAFHSGNETFPIQYQIKPASQGFNAWAYENWNGSAGYGTASDRRAKLVAVAYETTSAKQVSLTFGTKGKTLKSQATTLGYIMLPPMTVSEPKLYIYTDKGLGVADLKVPHVDAGTSSGDNTTNITNDRALTTIGYNDGAIVNITFDDTALDQPLALDIRTTDELVDLVYWSKDNTNASLTATLLTNEVELDPQVVTMLKNNKKINLTIEGDDKTLIIPAKSAKDAITISNLGLDVKTLKVVKGAEVNVPVLADVEKINNYGTINLIRSTTTPELYNEGTINVAGADDDWNGTVTASVGTITNKGIVNVTASYSTTIAELDNTYMGTANFIAGTTEVTEITNAWYDNGSAACKQGAMTIAKGATLDAEGTNGGTIFNEGTLKGGMENETNVDNVSWWPYTIDVPAEIQSTGVINGVLNNGLITLLNNEARVITNVSSEGEIDNTVQSPYVTKGDDEAIIAKLSGEMKASEIVAVVKGTNASKLYLNGTLTLDPEKDKDGNLVDIRVIGQQPTLEVIANGNLTIKGEGKLIFNADKSNTTYADFTINSGKTVTVKTDAIVATGDLNVDGTLLIQSGATVIVKGTTTNEDNIENYGTLM